MVALANIQPSGFNPRKRFDETSLYELAESIKRQETKILLRRLKRDNPNIENSIFRSIHAVALDTMPGYKSEGVEHSFLERFHAQEEAFNEE